MDAAVLQREARRNEHFRRLLHLYVQAFMTQIAQSTACNRLHAAEQRLARWLLICRDRVGRDEMPITQETMAMMLGVRRATVTEAASSAAARGAHPVPPRRGLDRGPARAGSRDVRVLPDRAGGVRPAARSARRVSIGDGHRARRGRREHGPDARAADAGARSVQRRRGRGRRIGAPAHRARPAGDRRRADRPGDAGNRRVRHHHGAGAPPPGPARRLHVGLRLGLGATSCRFPSSRSHSRSRRCATLEPVLARSREVRQVAADGRRRASRERAAANGFGGRRMPPAPTPSTWSRRRSSSGGSARSHRGRVRFSGSRAWRNWQTRRT